MAHLKKSELSRSFLNDLIEEQKRRELENPVINEHWYVADSYPSVRESDTYSDYWTRARIIKASPYFNTLQEAEEWESKNDPESGASLVIQHENLRRFTEDRWVAW